MSKLQINNYQSPLHQWLPMVGSQALGIGLVKDGRFAADMLKFEPGQCTSVHTHPGDHILFVVNGNGFLLYDGDRYDLIEGACYFVPGAIPHQVSATSIMFLLSVSNDHRTVDSAERLRIIQ